LKQQQLLLTLCWWAALPVMPMRMPTESLLRFAASHSAEH